MTKEPLRENVKVFWWLKEDIQPPSDVTEGLRVLKVLDKADKDLKRKR